MKAIMKYLWHLVTKYPISALLILFTWIISLIPIPETPLNEVRFVDKWTHVTLYLLLALTIGAEFTRHHGRSDRLGRFLAAFVLPIAMGGLVEIVQMTCTGGRRSGDWIDFADDGAGVLTAWIIGMLLAKCLSRGGKDC